MRCVAFVHPDANTWCDAEPGIQHHNDADTDVNADALTVRPPCLIRYPLSFGALEWICGQLRLLRARSKVMIGVLPLKLSSMCIYAVWHWCILDLRRVSCKPHTGKTNVVWRHTFQCYHVYQAGYEQSAHHYAGQKKILWGAYSTGKWCLKLLI